ncbi:hypothetical protein DPMN_065342 [Dreissena polymorpha]|uniref:Uncharacterized protein n=1 Tax=Dreissena polymorpha TaxID=45954 RepID=A0A9D4CFL1_DREPO|nr:hypothetical protein DPMN_065342 [Dreissena polymorpha]
MNIPHRILSADGTTKSLTESDYSGEYGASISSVDVSNNFTLDLVDMHLLQALANPCKVKTFLIQSSLKGFILNSKILMSSQQHKT